MSAAPSPDRLPRMFPVFLRLEGRPVLVVGGGAVAAEKTAALLRAGARVTVLAPEAAPPIREAAASRRLEWKARPYRMGDVLGYRLVVASTGNRRVNEDVSRDASGWSIPVNVVDVPDLCDFYFGSVIRRGPVAVAISTAGSSPALAQRLRRLLERVLPRRLDRLARDLARTRPALLASVPGFEDRVRAVDRLLDDLSLPRLDEKSDEEIGARVSRWIGEVRS